MPADADERIRGLIDRYGALITWAVRRVAGPGTREVDDIRQEVLVGLWTQVSRGRAIAHPSAYVHRAAVRETVRALARARVREVVVGGDAGELPAATVEADVLSRREQRQALRSAITALPLDRRRAVQGHLAGFTVQELMDLYGWSYQRTRNLIARGMADLRGRLREDPGLDGAPFYGRSAAAQARARLGPAAAHSACSAR